MIRGVKLHVDRKEGRGAREEEAERGTGRGEGKVE